MSALIDELKREHKGMAELLAMVQGKGAVDEEVRKRLGTAKQMFLAHLKKEDEKLYPVLKKAAATNPQLKSKLDMFAKDMEAITQAANEFFTKLESNAFTGLEYARSIGKLYTTLGGRIQREESVLYAEYDKIVSQQSVKVG